MSKFYIKLTQNKMALVDEEEVELLSQFSWSAVYPNSSGKWYAMAYMGGGRSNMQLVLMHRFLLGLSTGDPRQCDHIDGSGLNNTKSNLRIATPAQNSYNKAKQRNCSSEYKGVTWFNRDGKWKAQIMKQGTNYHLGYFVDELEAALAYDSKAKELFGEYARTNF